jgi:hypothetical protein
MKATEIKRGFKSPFFSLGSFHIYPFLKVKKILLFKYLSTGQIFYTVIARPQRGRSNPVFGWLFGLLHQDCVLPRNDENRQFSSAVKNMSGGKL